MKGTTSLQPRRMKMTTIRMAVAFLAVAVLGAVGIAINQDAQAQSFQPPNLLHVIDPLSSLKSIPVPEPRNLARYIKDRNAAIALGDRKSTRLNSSHRCISYAVFCLKKK